MKINCLWEHNGKDTLLYSTNFLGAYAIGETLDIAKRKMPQEINSFLKWSGIPFRPNEFDIEITEEKISKLNICDADSDAIFNTEKLSMTISEYEFLKALALKSATDFLELYNFVPDKEISCLPERSTFYGTVPRTATEMYEHTKNVNGYYFGEIGVNCENGGDILSCRKRGFKLSELLPSYLDNKLYTGSYNESWTLKKVLRRFIWHDRIHAKAMYRMAIKTFGENSVPNIFCFENL